MSRKRFRPSPAMVVAVLALVAALAGTAVAANPTARTAAKKVTKKQAKKIANRQATKVVNKEIDGLLPLGTSDLANQAITQQKLASGSVATGKLQSGAVTTSRLAESAVSNSKLRDDSVRSEALGAVNLRQETEEIDDMTGDSVEVACNSGERLLGGGAGTQGVAVDADWTLVRSGPFGNGWSAAARNETGTPGTLVAQALCLASG